MPLRHDEIKEVQEIAMTAAKTASIVAYKEVVDKITAVEKRLAALEKTIIAPTKQGKKE